MSVRASQDALPGSGQKHQPTAGDVCAVQLVDGAQANDSRVGGMTAPKTVGKCPKTGPNGPKEVEIDEEIIVSFTI